MISPLSNPTPIISTTGLYSKHVTAALLSNSNENIF
jgi:hypothetical protein